jgi:uncharacterized membrane protein YvbJ
METNFCPHCQSEILTTYFFCPSCGKQLKLTDNDTSVFKQLIIYGISFFLPPFGLSYAFKYYLVDDTKAKHIALIATILTILSIVFALGVLGAAFSSVSTELKQQMGDYKDLGI